MLPHPLQGVADGTAQNSCIEDRNQSRPQRSDICRLKEQGKDEGKKPNRQKLKTGKEDRIRPMHIVIQSQYLKGKKQRTEQAVGISL